MDIPGGASTAESRSACVHRAMLASASHHRPPACHWARRRCRAHRGIRLLLSSPSTIQRFVVMIEHLSAVDARHAKPLRLRWRRGDGNDPSFSAALVGTCRSRDEAAASVLSSQRTIAVLPTLLPYRALLRVLP